MTVNSEAAKPIPVVIVGAGFAGLGAAIQLRSRGVTDLLILERNHDVGGTWHDNTYPGCQCDVQSNLYSFSFALNPEWSRTYSPQPEIRAYLQKVADDFNVRKDIRFGCHVEAITWDAAEHVWRLTTSQGALSARVLIAAHGAFSEPTKPELSGLDEFQGDLLHSARWNHKVSLEGRRVGVIGTGASAIQIVPAIQPVVQSLKVYQRTPPWVVPRFDGRNASWKMSMYRHVPFLQRGVRWAQYLGRELLVPSLVYSPMLARWVEKWARMHLKRQVANAELRAQLTPQYRIGCKRILLSNEYYPALQQPNTELITQGVERVTRTGIRTSDGREHELDALVLATGFRVANHPMTGRIRGRSGATLEAAWRNGAASYLGITVPDFPNFFLLSGPNSGIGHTSLVFMIEAQIRYTVQAIQWLLQHPAGVLEVRQADCDAFVNEMQRRSTSTTWGAGSCNSWYLDEHGRNTTVWPGFTFEYWWRTRRFSPTQYNTAPHV